MISDNGISKVWLKDSWIYKQQPKFLCDNEIWILEKLYPTGFVPHAIREDIVTIRLEYIKNEPVTDCQLFKHLMRQAVKALRDNGIRHGDLTEKNVLVKGNHPYLIDFSESRLACDPRLDKRREGDEYWMNETIKRLCNV